MVEREALILAGFLYAYYSPPITQEERPLANEPDQDFYNRADAIIELANTHISDSSRGKASASLMYANSRFAAWVSACGCRNAEELAAAKQQAVDYFVEEFRLMMEENLTDYIENFSLYMTPQDS